MEEAAEPVGSPDADVVLGGRGMGPAVGWLLAESPVRAVGVVVIDVFAERVVEMPSAGDEDAIGALAPRTGDPALADRVRPWRLARRCDNPRAGRGEDRVGVLGVPVSVVRNFKPSVRSPRSMSVFRACCTVQAAARGWAGDAGQVNAAICGARRGTARGAGAGQVGLSRAISSVSRRIAGPARGRPGPRRDRSVAADQVGGPAQERARDDDQGQLAAARGGEPLGKNGQDRPVGAGQPR